MEDGYKYLLQLFVLFWARFDVPFNPNTCKEMRSCEYSESIKPLETFVTWQLRAGLSILHLRIEENILQKQNYVKHRFLFR